VIGRRSFLAAAAAAVGAPGATAQSLVLAPGEALRGRFNQQRFLQGFATPLVSTGSFILAPGRGVAWRGETPFAIHTVVAPRGLVQRVVGGATTTYPATRLPAIVKLYEIFASALSGDWQKLGTTFDVRRQDTGGAWKVTLTPLRADSGMPLRSVDVLGRQYVDTVEVVRQNGDRDRIDFSQQTPSRDPIERDIGELFDLASRQ
jgi:hypothetical protein